MSRTFDRFKMTWDRGTQLLEVETVTVKAYRPRSEQATLEGDTDLMGRWGWFMSRGDIHTERVSTVEEMLEKGWIEEVAE